MSTHRKHEQNEVFYFITFTCHNWLPLFDESNLYSYFPTWFNRIAQKHCLINAYCIMPNHLHMICFPQSKCSGINHVIGEAKRFLAYEVVKRLKESGRSDMLDILTQTVKPSERKKGKQHQVFRLSFDAKEVGYDSIDQVLDYIHLNPVKGKWHLADDHIDYLYSSAAYYETAKHKPDFLTDYRDIYSEVKEV